MTMIKEDIKRLLRSKKGAAIEMAILLMVVIFLFSSLITVAFLSTHSTYKRQVDKMTESALIDSFGEAFVKSNDRPDFKLDSETGYTAEVSGDGSTLTIKDAESENVRLVVTVDGSGKVKSWQSFVESGEADSTAVSDTQETSMENKD